MSNKTSTHEPGKKPQWLNINDVLFYQSKAGDELTFDLDFPSEVFAKAMGEGGDDERSQFLIMLDALGDEYTIAKVREMGALEQMRVITHFFETFAKAVGAQPGEFVGSSDS